MRPPLRDRIIPWYFVMAFMVVFAVNGVFVYMATSTHSGVVSEHAYEQGLEYDSLRATAAQQTALGWQADLQLQLGKIVLQLIDADGKPLEDAAAQVLARWPVKQGQDVTLILTPQGGGAYTASRPLPRKGQWDVTVNIEWKQHAHQFRKRLYYR